MRVARVRPSSLPSEPGLGCLIKKSSVSTVTKKTKNQKKKISKKAKTKRERKRGKKIQNKQTNKAQPTSTSNQPAQATRVCHPGGGSLARGGGVAGGIVRGTEAETPQEPPGRRRGDRAGERDRGPRARPGLGRQKWDWSEVERCQGENSRHPSGRQVSEGSIRGRPSAALRAEPLAALLALVPRMPAPQLPGESLPGIPLCPEDNPVLSAFSDLPNPPLRRLWWVGVLSHQAFPP